MNWKQALALGLCSVGAYGQKATMYSYNGTVLPALPEWDKTAYPYACIIRFLYVYGDTSNYYYSLYCTDNPICVDKPSATQTRWKISPTTQIDASMMKYNGVIVDEVIFDDPLTVNNNIISGVPIWANHDVTVLTGTRIYLEASDPIPVYE